MSTEEKKVRRVKIEGEAFDRVKAKTDAVRLIAEEMKRQLEVAHAELWDVICAECPDFKRDEDLTLDIKHEDLDFYIVSEKRKESIGSLLREIKTALKGE